MASSTTTTTVLRVKRPRHVAPLPLLRVDLESRKRARTNNNVLEEGMSRLMHQSSYIAAQQQQQTVTWKRVEDTAAVEAAHERIHYVDARLDEEESDDGRQTKRRRLALTLVQTPHHPSVAAPTTHNSTAARKKHVIILDPLSRLVDDSLKQVFGESRTLEQHLDFIEEDERLANAKEKNWYSWCLEGGNVLHAAALQNNVESVARIPLTSELLMGLDSDGRTPHQVATMVGHTNVADMLVMETSGDDIMENDEDFVYDVFCIQKEEESNKDEMVKTTTATTPTAELRGGIGYWNEEGELVLEALQEEQNTQDDGSVDDDIDSNCEDYEGNDYPDELDDEEESLSDDDENNNFRNRPMVLPGVSNLGLQRNGKVGVIHNIGKAATHTAAYSNHDDDNDEYYDNIVSEYDHYEGNPQPERLYAYDPELDDSYSD